MANSKSNQFGTTMAFCRSLASSSRNFSNCTCHNVNMSIITFDWLIEILFHVNKAWTNFFQYLMQPLVFIKTRPPLHENLWYPSPHFCKFPRCYIIFYNTILQWKSWFTSCNQKNNIYTITTILHHPDFQFMQVLFQILWKKGLRL